jgi:hypothetical protein
MGVSDVIADTPTGLVVLHVRVTLQVLAPAAMVHEGAAGVSVPDIAAVADEADTDQVCGV